MALEYGLYVETDLHPQRALELIFKGISTDVHLEKPKRRGLFLCTHPSGLTTDAYRFKDSDFPLIAADLGVKASMRIMFRLDKFKDREVQKQVLLQATIELLSQVNGDAVLLFNGEVIWLLRRDGELTLNSSKDLWRPNLLALAMLPYKMTDIPTL